MGNAQKFAFAEICTTPKKLPTQIYPLSLLAQVRVSPFSFFNRLSTTITTRRLLQALQPLDCMPRRQCWFQSTKHFLCRLIVLIEHLFWSRLTAGCNLLIFPYSGAGGHEQVKLQQWGLQFKIGWKQVIRIPKPKTYSGQDHWCFYILQCAKPFENTNRWPIGCALQAWSVTKGNHVQKCHQINPTAHICHIKLQTPVLLWVFEKIVIL